MWALGVILYQFFSNRLPFEADTPHNTENLILKCEPAPLSSTVSPLIEELIAKLLHKNPENRPDA
jgi:serine/threonine protein kinase